MTAVFVGGSRHVSRLSAAVRGRLDSIMAQGHRVLVGDAGGADAAVQRHLHTAGYDAVAVYCSGAAPRTNAGGWAVEAVPVPASARGFAFYAEKDRAMARAADFGLMIWDGKSPGTVLNVLRMVRLGKPTLLYRGGGEGRGDDHQVFRTGADWDRFLAGCDGAFVEALRRRATPEEWSGPTRTSETETP
ncbi:hypothetical protein [Roseospira goensis]|uniref:Uncharacterized protein n=1 Tax=Roseospira goensis TaxID=391922 RepID=A0A7W6WJZ9_9PROT|nr:hypothetical protein [Roseospira goensis]MBB4285013.1 hypothetical protein [Roseospira goensis]